MIERIKAALEQILKDGPVDKSLGICGNINEILGDDQDLYCYDFVFFNCVGWKGIKEPQDWPVDKVRYIENIPKNVNKWEGDEGKLRQSLIKHLIYVIDNNHVNHCRRED